MDGGAMALPVLGVVAIAAATFYAISFIELREVTPIQTLLIDVSA
jgi:hypothetical protein